MASHRLEITVSPDTLKALDSARGYEPRASFVKRALESALEPVAADYSRLRIEASVDERAASRSGAFKREQDQVFATPRAASSKPDPDAPTSMAEAAKRATLPPGVKTARQLAMERQRKLNERKP